MKCGVHEELCELSGEARIEELRRVVRGVVAAHLSGVGDAFEMRLVPEGISLDDDESVAHLSAGSCVEVVPSPVQVLAERGIPLHWDSVVEATRSKRYDDVGWLLQAGVHNVYFPIFLEGAPLEDATVLNLLVEHDVVLAERILNNLHWRLKGHMGTLVEAALARGSDRFKNDLLLTLLSAPPVKTEFYRRYEDDPRNALLVEAIPYCEALIPVSPLDGIVTALCAREDVTRFVGLLLMLLEHGAAVDRDVFVNLRGIMPLEAIRQLVQKGADPNADLLEGQFLGRKTRYKRELLNIESLVACGMDIETVCSDGNTTILTRHVLTNFRNVAQLEKLVLLGANPNIFDKDGDTLAMHAAKRRRWNTLEALLQSDKIDINQTSHNGLTVLMYVAGQGSQCGTRTVLAAHQKPDLEVEDTKGRTCLAHAASFRKGAPVVKLLLAHGAKVDGSATTCSPLEQALQHSHDICKVLLDNGADPLHMTSGGITCLALAESYSEETAELLRGYLAKTPPGQESRGVKRKREEPEPAVEEATESAQEQGSEDEKKEEDATEHSCRACGVTQTALGVPFASEASVRSHVTSKHRMKWSDYLARYEE